jgi:hypothetical protein
VYPPHKTAGLGEEVRIIIAGSQDDDEIGKYTDGVLVAWMLHPVYHWPESGWEAIETEKRPKARHRERGIRIEDTASIQRKG